MLKFFFYNYADSQTSEEIIESIRTLVEGTLQYEWMEEYMLFVTVPFLSLESVLKADLSDRHRVKIAASRFSVSEPLLSGEVSLQRLKELGTDLVTAGLADLRFCGAESSAQAAEKAGMALDAGLKVLFAVGEDEASLREGTSAALITEQLRPALQRIPLDSFYRCALLYKPLWAFSTSAESSRQSYRDQMFEQIRAAAAKERPEFPEPLPLIYGGPLQAAEAKELLTRGVLDGVMIDSFRMNTEEMLALIHSCY